MMVWALTSFHQTVIEDDCLPMDQFAVHLMPHLLTLANDRVPNVRVLLAKTLRQTLLEKGGWQPMGHVWAGGRVHDGFLQGTDRH